MLPFDAQSYLTAFILSLSFHSPVAYADSSQDKSSTEHRSDLLPNEFEFWHNQRKLSHSIQTTDMTLELQSEVYFLFQGALNKYKTLKLNHPQMSESDFLKTFIEKSQVSFSNPGQGHSEMSIVDGAPIFRVAHYSSGLSFLILDSKVNLNGDHLKQLISRQHIISNNGKGRNVVIGVVDDIFKLEDSAFFESARLYRFNRPSMLTPTFWKEYWIAIWKKPVRQDVSFALFNGVFQFVTSMTTAGVVTVFGFQANHPVESATLAFVYGSAVGSVYSTFRNWNSFGVKAYKIIDTKGLKIMTNSIIYSYLLSYFLSGGSLERFDPTTFRGLVENAILIFTNYVNSLSKDNWYNLAAVREKMGIARGNYTVLGYDTGWKKASVEFSLAYLPNFSFRLVERLLNTSGHLVGGVGVLFAQIPISEYIALKHAEKLAAQHQHPEAMMMADRLRSEWDRKMIGKTIKGISDTTKKVVYPSCSKVFVI